MDEDEVFCEECGEDITDELQARDDEHTFCLSCYAIIY